MFFWCGHLKSDVLLYDMSGGSRTHKKDCLEQKVKLHYYSYENELMIKEINNNYLCTAKGRCIDWTISIFGYLRGKGSKLKN